MLIYEYQPTIQTFSLLEPLLPGCVRERIKAIMDAAPEAMFFCKIEDMNPSIRVYLLEHDPADDYTECHLLSCDRIGQDYEYLSLSVEQARSVERFAAQIPVISRS